jgi:hypothetical protein
MRYSSTISIFFWRRRGAAAVPQRRRNIYEFSILNCGMTVRSTRGVGKKKRHTNLTELEINTLENEVSNLTKDAEFPCNTINIYSLEFI